MAVSVAVFPAHIVAPGAVGGTGVGFTVTVAIAVPVQPEEFLPVTV